MGIKDKGYIRRIRNIIIWIIVSIIAILICTGAMNIVHRQNEINDKIIIDVFGRQRSLSQAIGKDASSFYSLMQAIEENPGDPSSEVLKAKVTRTQMSLRKSQQAFSTTLGFMHAGYLDADDKRIEIKRKIRCAISYIEEIDRIWNVFDRSIDVLAAADGLDEETAAAASYIHENNMRLLELCENVSESILAESVRNSKRMEYFVFGFVSLIVLFLVAAFYTLLRYIFIPYNELYKGLSEIGIANAGSAEASSKNDVRPIINEIEACFLQINDLFALIENMNHNATFMEILTFISRTFSTFIPYNYIGIALFGNDGKRLKASYGVSDGSIRGLPENLVGKSVAVTETSLEKLIENGEARIINDLEAYTAGRPLKEYNNIILSAGIRASITLPLKLAGGPVGVIFFSSSQKNVYTEEHVRFLRMLANSIAVSFHQNIFINDLLLSGILALAKLADARDEGTGEHLDRMKTYSRVIAELLMESGVYKDEISHELIENIEKFSPLHDIGKVGIPDGILLKQGKLTPEEFELMKNHTIYGAEVLRAAEANIEKHGKRMFGLGIEIAEAHHEKWDGSGYPYGRSGLEIPLSARIVTVADVFDALTTKRPYKEAFSFEESFRMISEGSGRHFDPEIASVFAANRDEIYAIYHRFHAEA